MDNCQPVTAFCPDQNKILIRDIKFPAVMGEGTCYCSLRIGDFWFDWAFS